MLTASLRRCGSDTSYPMAQLGGRDWRAWHGGAFWAIFFPPGGGGEGMGTAAWDWSQTRAFFPDGGHSSPSSLHGRRLEGRYTCTCVCKAPYRSRNLGQLFLRLRFFFSWRFPTVPPACIFWEKRETVTGHTPQLQGKRRRAACVDDLEASLPPPPTHARRGAPGPVSRAPASSNQLPSEPVGCPASHPQSR